jgi:hypothetical protein
LDRHANQLPIQIETQIVRVKQDKPSWGAPKIREEVTRVGPLVIMTKREETSAPASEQTAAIAARELRSARS